MRQGLVWACIVLVLPAGCLGGSDDAPAPIDSENRSRTTDDTGGSQPSNATGPPNASSTEAGTITFYATAQGRLTDATPTSAEPATAPTPSFFPALVTGDFELPTWEGGPTPAALTVTAARIVAYYTQDTPGRRDPSFPPFGAYWGQTDGTLSFSFGGDDETIDAGEVIEFTVDLPMPPGGLVFPTGSSQQLMLVGGFQPSADGVSNPRFLVDSVDTPTRVEIAYGFVGLPETTEVEAVRETGTVQGAECFAAPTEGSSVTIPFDVPPEAAGLRVVLTRTGGQGQQDVDFDLFGPSGDIVTGGHTPSGNEVVVLYQPNLEVVGTGAWQAQVTACGAQASDFELVVSVMNPIP